MKKVWPWVIWMGLALVLWLAPFPSQPPPPADKFFRLTAAQFAYSPSTLRVNPGDRVTIELASTDVVHGLAVDGHAAEMTADPGQTQIMAFVAGRPGAYRFRCTVTCGNLHPFMIGKLQIGPNTLYWRAAGLSFLALLAGFWRLRA